MHIPWSEVELLLAVADAGSLSGAAKMLRVTQPTISRRLADLEGELGEPLFVRTVEGTSPTSFGERMLEPARRMFESAREIDHVASGADTKPRGVVRLTAPPGVAFDFVAPFAVHLREKLPEVRLEVVSTVSYLDLGKREADLGLRVAPLDRPSTQRDLVTLASLHHGVALFATRAYIETLPRGYGIGDIGFIGWAPPLEHLPPNPQLAAKIPGFRPAFASDDFLVQLRAAEAGVGAIVLGRYKHRLSLPTALVEMKLDLGNLTSSLHLVCARASLTIPRVRAVAELLTQEMESAIVPRVKKRA